MTCFTAAAAFLVFLYPDQRQLAFTCMVLLLGGGLYSAFKAIEAMRDKPMQHSQHSDLARAALSARLGMEFGDKSRKCKERVELGTARLEEFEAEIRAGDFSRAPEILAHKEPLLAVFSEFFGTASHAYQSRRTQLFDLIARVESHIAETKPR